MQNDSKNMNDKFKVNIEQEQAKALMYAALTKITPPLGKQEQAKGLMDAALAMQKGGYTPEGQAQSQAFAAKLKGQAEGLLGSAAGDKGNIMRLL
jgi:hypothetical protein